jgi:hypothetical protein
MAEQFPTSPAIAPDALGGAASVPAGMGKADASAKAPPRLPPKPSSLAQPARLPKSVVPTEVSQRWSAPARSASAELVALREVGRLRPRRLVPAWVASGLVHALLLIVFGLWAIPPETKQKMHELMAFVSADIPPVEAVQQQPRDMVVINNARLDLISSTMAQSLTSVVDVSPAPQATPASADVRLSEFGVTLPRQGDLLSRVGGGAEQGLIGVRSDAGRRAAVVERGGNTESEAAVAKALEWLAVHQFADGSWSFDHTRGTCKGRCHDPGSMSSSVMAATAMGLLPFLGAGQTHKQGKYKKQVQNGLSYLTHHMRLGPHGGDMSEPMGGLMYSHGLATIALCEAYAMTQDRRLIAPAQVALNFIMYAQDPLGGGWRYTPGTPGDTSVLGWQLMALKSGHLGYLQVRPQTIAGATHFLDSVQDEEGVYYGYDRPEQRLSTTAIGLLCRMYLGWKHDEPALVKGVQILSHQGPSPTDVYFNYYTTQVLHHYEGPLWEKWNEAMRDQLVRSQSRSGHEAGSWYIKDDPHVAAGGRLYHTAMCAMILEVYYRHLPLYRKQTTDDDF